MRLRSRSEIVEAADADRPFSLLRLEIGEGALLPYRAELAEFRATDLASNGRTWWGTGEMYFRLRQRIQHIRILPGPRRVIYFTNTHQRIF